MEQKRNKWIKWIVNIQKEAEQLLQSKYIFSKYMETIKKNPKIQIPGDIHWWVRDNYVAFITMSIRRQAEWKDPDIVSLGKLLYEITEKPQIITKQWYVDTFKYDLSETDFADISGPGEIFDPKIAKTDLEKLNELSKHISKFADRRIAHSSKQPIPSVTMIEVDTFIESFEEILTKYILLFTGVGYAGIRPVQQYDITEIFTIPWIEKED